MKWNKFNSGWQTWFAWYPVCVGDQTVWLEKVERILRPGGSPESSIPAYPGYEYRLLKGTHSFTGGPDGACKDCQQPVI